MRATTIALLLTLFSLSAFARSKAEMDSVLAQYRHFLLRSVPHRFIDSVTTIYMAGSSPDGQWAEFMAAPSWDQLATWRREARAAAE